MAGLSQPDYIFNNNPNEPLNGFSTQIKGGRRVVNILSDLFTLISAINQLEVNITIVNVLEDGFDYLLIDINNITNINGWKKITDSNPISGSTAPISSDWAYRETNLRISSDNDLQSGLILANSNIASNLNLITGNTSVINILQTGLTKAQLDILSLTGYTITTDIINNTLGYVPASVDTLVESFTDVIVFNYNNTNNILNLSYTPKLIGFSTLQGGILDPYYDYYYSGQTMVLRVNNLIAPLVSGTTYKIITQYFK